MSKEIITLIQCPMSGKTHECCGCLVGTIDKEKGLIEFYCNECGYQAGYIDLKQFKKLEL